METISIRSFFPSLNGQLHMSVFLFYTYSDVPAGYCNSAFTEWVGRDAVGHMKSVLILHYRPEILPCWNELKCNLTLYCKCLIYRSIEYRMHMPCIHINVFMLMDETSETVNMKFTPDIFAWNIPYVPVPWWDMQKVVLPPEALNRAWEFVWHCA